MTKIAATITPALITMKRRTPTQSRRQQQQKQQSNKNGNSNGGDEKVAIIISNKIVFVNQVLITIRTNPVVRIMPKRYFRHSLQRSVPMWPLSSEYFSNRFLSVKGLMGQFCQPM